VELREQREPDQARAREEPEEEAQAEGRSGGGVVFHARQRA
jgi:hypothetical protein